MHQAMHRHPKFPQHFCFLFSCSIVPFEESSASVKSQIPIFFPNVAYFAIVPPMPISTSSAWAPKAKNM